MLNEAGARELVYITRIDKIEPIEGRDRVECATVNGWKVMVHKGAFEEGGLGIYFEIDSKTPETEPFMFLSSKHFKIKTQKYKTPSGHFYSQGLLMAAEDFGWTMYQDGDGQYYIHDNEKNISYPEGTFLTKELGVTYADPDDNKRKAKTDPNAKYKSMMARHPKFAKTKFARWCMKRDWAKKILYIFLGRKKDNRGWPAWVKKTDEERVENLPQIFSDKEPWIATEKIDGTSTTFTMKKNRFGKYNFYVGSRNVIFDKPNKNCFYDTNVYLEMAEKYNVENILRLLFKRFPEAEWITLQGETYGGNIQKRNYSIKEHKFLGFNLITSDKGRLNSIESDKIMSEYKIPWVPILNENYILPDTLEELRNYVNSEPSKIDGLIKEGIVFRSKDGLKSFKCVSPEFLIQYHN